jgi:CHAT domain-containing protein/tetratricopeptide (TPR) repeat protein
MLLTEHRLLWPNYRAGILLALIALGLNLLHPSTVLVRAGPLPRSAQLFDSSGGARQDGIGPALEAGKPVERVLKGGEVHAYSIALNSGDYLHADVDQRGIDVVVTLFGPDGKKLAEKDSPNGEQGPEPVSIIAQAAGSYRLEVRSLEKGVAAGRYEVRVTELRPATPQDGSQIAAERAYAEGTLLRNQGTAEFQRKAVGKYEEALTLSRAAGDHSGEADALNTIGLILPETGEMQKALDFLNQALRLERAQGFRRWEVVTLNGIGVVYYFLGEQQKALDFHTQALQLMRATGDRTGEATTLNDIGSIYRDLRDFGTALLFFNQALELSRAVGYRTEEAHALHEIGLIYLDLGEKQKALDYLSETLPLIREVFNRSYFEARSLSSIGWVHYSLGEQQKALDFYNQALRLERAAGYRRWEADTLYGIGLVYYSLGEQQKALDFYNQALQLMRATGGRGGEAMTLTKIALIERDRGNLTRARSLTETALDLVESLRTKVASYELRATYFASVHGFYELYIDLLMRLHRQHGDEGHDGAALQASERARSRSLLELLAESGGDIRQGVDTELLDRERTLRQQLNAQAERQMRLLGGPHTEEQAVAAAREIEALTTEYRDVEARIRLASPHYAALTHPQPLSLRDIQTQVLLSPDTLLLEYSLGEEKSYLWAVSTTSINSYELPKRAEIEAAARHLYEQLTVRDRGERGENLEGRQEHLTGAEAAYTEAAATLSRMVLSPAAALLGSKRLLIVADGALQYVPFAALPLPGTTGATDGGRPLVADHEVVSLPSASTLGVMRRELAGRKPAAKLVAVLADPVFDKDDARIRPGPGGRGKEGAGERVGRGDGQENVTLPLPPPDIQRALSDVGVGGGGPGIPRLLFTRREAEAILAVTPAGTGMAALDFRANRATATSSELGQYRIVHFATHGLLNSEHPELSGLVLSLVDEQGRPVNGFLRLHEVYNLHLPAELVVLSACQTGLGREVRGEGLVGLTRGFMYAGAARVAASLWKVDDAATRELMGRFYRGMLKEGLRPSAALRAAQLEMWRTKRWREPYYWAAFVLQGDWR